MSCFSFVLLGWVGREEGEGGGGGGGGGGGCGVNYFAHGRISSFGYRLQLLGGASLVDMRFTGHLKILFKVKL